MLILIVGRFILVGGVEVVLQWCQKQIREKIRYNFSLGPLDYSQEDIEQN